MLRNTSESWGWPTRALHWIVAAMVLGLFAQGLWMEDLAREQRTYQTWLHAAEWQRRAARLAHWALYALIFGVSITGWALTGTMREPVAIALFGFIEVPQLVGPDSGTHELFEELHEILANVLIALVAVHAAAALYHHFVLRDGVLRRMLWRKPMDEA